MSRRTTAFARKVMQGARTGKTIHDMLPDSRVMGEGRTQIVEVSTKPDEEGSTIRRVPGRANREKPCSLPMGYDKRARIIQRFGK